MSERAKGTDRHTGADEREYQGFSRRKFLKYAGAAASLTLLGTTITSAMKESTDAPGRPLRNYAQFIKEPYGNPFNIGVFLEPGDLFDSTGIPLQISDQQFNHRVNLSVSMFDSYRAPDQWDFNLADFELQQAQSANQSVIGAPLVWGTEALDWATPEWIRTGGYSRDQVITLMEDHIETVLTTFRGLITSYIVVNEALTGATGGSGMDDWWHNQIGPEYITLAFQKARQSDPDATLIYNHYNNHIIGQPNFDVTKNHVEDLDALGLIDAVSCQLHLASIRPEKSDVTSAFQSYGLPVWVTEFDSYQLQPEEVADPEQEQATITKKMFEATLESGVCDHFTVWGFSDRNSFWGDDKKTCLWDDNFNAKKNYYAIKEALLAAAPPIRDLFMPIISR